MENIILLICVIILPTKSFTLNPDKWRWYLEGISAGSTSMDSKYQRERADKEAQGPYRFSLVVIPGSTSWSCLISGKSVVSKGCTRIEAVVRLELGSLAAPPSARRNSLNEFSASSVTDCSRTWSRLFNLKVAGVNSWFRKAH